MVEGGGRVGVKKSHCCVSAWLCVLNCPFVCPCTYVWTCACCTPLCVAVCEK